MHSILEKIQGAGNGRHEYTHDKAAHLELLLEKARLFYADNEEKENIRSNLIDNIIRLQGMISRYASDIDHLLAMGRQPDEGSLGQLKKEYRSIKKMEKNISDDLDRLELKH